MISCLRNVVFAALSAAAVLAAGAAVAAPFKTLSVVAGDPGGPGSRDGKAWLARFKGPTGVQFDGKSALYVADTANSTIRKIGVANGAVSTFAGLAGYVGSVDGKRKAARLNHPSGLAFDGLGRLFVADTGNNSIRIVGRTVSTAAGMPSAAPGSTDGPGPSATFNGPTGLAYDRPHNSIYIADTNNDTIRALDLTTGNVSTLAGMAGSPGSADGSLAAARFNQPIGLAFDGSSKLYVADSENYTIRQVDLSNGTVSTIAGSAGQSGAVDDFGSAARFEMPYGLATIGPHLFVSDAAADTLREVDLPSGQVFTLSGSAGQPGNVDGFGGARFSFPSGIALNLKNGNIYIADRDNSEIRSYVQTTYLVSTLAGAGPMPGSNDAGGLGASFDGPTGLVFDGVTNLLYVSDSVNQTIRRIDSTGTATTLAGTQGAVGSSDGLPGSGSFNGPLGLALDGAGDLFVADVNNDTIRIVSTSTGEVSTYAGSAGAVGSDDGFRTNARFNGPTGIAIDGNSALYVTDTGNDVIRKIDLNTQTVSTVAGDPGMAGWADGLGSRARFFQPTGIAFDGSFFYIADTGNNTIRMLSASGLTTTLAGTAGIVGHTNAVAGAASFNQPMGLTYAVLAGTTPTAVLFVADSGNSVVREIKLSTSHVYTALGRVGEAGVRAMVPGSTSGGAAPGGLNDPGGLAFSPTSGLYISDEVENVVLLAH